MERQNGIFLGRCVARALMACGVLMAAQATPVAAQALPKNCRLNRAVWWCLLRWERRPGW